MSNPRYLLPTPQYLHPSMQAEIITIGDEILIGQIVDTNSAWMAQQLVGIGISVKQISSIADRAEEIRNALLLASKNVDVILITGGLGPTNDDVTKVTLASYFGVGMHIDESVLHHVEHIFSRTNKPLLPQNRKQAEVLDNAEVLFNKSGTAPGMYISHQGCHYFIMPGVPTEMIYLMENEVLPRLQALPGRDALVNKSILTAGIGESFLALQLADIENSLPPHIRLAYLPAFGQVRLRLSAVGKNGDELAKELNSYTRRIKECVGEHIFSEDDVPLEAALLAFLKANKAKVCTAESCTGGHIAQMLTQIAGSSAAFEGGVVAYTNALKQQLLQVDATILERYGAVSEQTVRAMATGAKKHMKTDYAIATTGIAGPDGGTEANPVGTVWIAIAGKTKTIAKRFQFGQRRWGVIERASINAFILLFRLLREESVLCP